MKSQDCESVVFELPAYASRRLPTTAAASIERHLRVCSSCRLELQELENLEHVLDGYLPVIAPSATFASTFANRLAAEVLAEEERGGSAGLLGFRWRPWLIPLGVAATLALAVLSTTMFRSAPTFDVAGGDTDTRVAEAPAGGTQVATAPATAGEPAKPAVRTARVEDTAPPPELLERPDLFVDYSVIRQLDFLESAEHAG